MTLATIRTILLSVAWMVASPATDQRPPQGTISSTVKPDTSRSTRNP